VLTPLTLNFKTSINHSSRRSPAKADQLSTKNYFSAKLSDGNAAKL
jgi:hypothetical protein